MRCAYWRVAIDDTVGAGAIGIYKCVRCSDSFYPILLDVTTYNTSPATTADAKSGIGTDHMAYISACKPVNAAVRPEMQHAQKLYQGIMYQSWNKYTHGAFLSFDHCNDGNQALIVINNWHGAIPVASMFTFSNAGVQTDGVSSHVCVDLSTTVYFTAAVTNKYSLPGGVADCQINHLTHASGAISPWTQTTAVNGSVFKCYACRPGYHPFSVDTLNEIPATTESLISSCAVILNCDQTAGTNKWMNSCQTCNSTHAWNWDESANVIQFHKCVARTSHPNCKILDLTNSKCKMCDQTFYLNTSRKCVSRSLMKVGNCAADTSANNPFLRHELVFADSTVSLKNLYYMAFLQKTWSFTKPYCTTCDTNTILTYVPPSTEICDNSYMQIDPTQTPNADAKCVQWDKDDLTKCVQCSTGFTVESANSSTDLHGTSCYDFGTHAQVTMLGHCLVSTDTGLCISCKFGVRILQLDQRRNYNPLLLLRSPLSTRSGIAIVTTL